MTKKSQTPLPWGSLITMAGITFFALISELIPSGLLGEIAEGLSTSHAQAGNLVGIYALPAAILAIPITQMVAKYDRKHIMAFVAAGFSLSNLLVSVSRTYIFALVARIFGGAMAGVFWPLVASYAGQLVEERHSGRAVTIVLSGSTIGVSVGLPLFTKLGQLAGWRAAFVTVSVCFFAISLLSMKTLPSVPGQPAGKQRSVKSVFGEPGIKKALLIVIAMVLGQYSTYVFIQVITQKVMIDLSLAQILFGIACIIMVMIVARYIDTKLGQLLLSVFALGIVVMLVLLYGRGPGWLMYLVMFIWGLSYGPMSTLLQNTTMKQVEEGKDTAASIQTAAFDGSILLSSLIGGFVLDKWGIQANLLFALIMFAFAIFVIVSNKQYFFDN